MPDDTATKAAQITLHRTYILANKEGTFCQVACDDCSFKGPDHGDRRYLAEFEADEHQRAMAGWPQPPSTTPIDAVMPHRWDGQLWYCMRCAATRPDPCDCGCNPHCTPEAATGGTT
jgi:hypothetical protein